MPTWLTGALVSVWIARSAAVRPRNSHRSPVRVTRAAASTDMGPAGRSVTRLIVPHVV